MRARVAWTLLGMAGVAAAPVSRAQELVQVSYSWSEVVAGTLTPVTSPNSVLEPGEGARIGINIFATINGTNAVGQTTTYTPPPPPGFGTVRGIASAIYNLSGNNGAATAAGSWNDRAISPILGTGAFAGNSLNGGATLDSFGGGQFIPVGQTANSTNPVADFFRGVWNPASYQTRWVHFAVDSASRHGQQNGILVQYGTGYVDPTDPSTAYGLYLTKYVGSNFGSGFYIPIAPAPAGSLVLAGVAVAASRRRRR